MGLRDRREQRREERATFGRGGTAVHYRIRQRLVSIGDDYWIEDDAGDRVFRVDGKALRLRSTFDIEDVRGAKVCRIQTRVLHLRDSMAVEDPDGHQLALVHKALISPLRERWKVDLADDREWKVQGNVVDHEYEIEDDGHKIAEISKRWFRVRDTYGVEVAPGGEQGLVLAVAIAIDAMTHPAK
jgi:uncharacterized protein YxjI